MHSSKFKRRIKISGALLSLIFGFLFSANITTYAQDGAIKKLNDENLRDTEINPHRFKGEYEIKNNRHTGSTTIVGDTTCGGGDPRACAPTAAAPVPEPVTLILFGTGLAAIGYKARKGLSKKK